MRLLIVEDESALADSICQYLSSENFLCEIASTFQNALERIECWEYDCIILDIGLPDGNGLKLLSILKEDQKEDGVLIISAKDSLDDRITGLRMGADDYLVKPFHLSELSARLEAIIRRKSFSGSNVLQYDVLTIDVQQQTVQVEGALIDLTRKEYDLLLYFISNKTKVISKNALASHLWGEMSDGLLNYDFIYTHIKNLRRKLLAAGSPDYIQSVYGMGYKLRIP
jgi:DNA-binding response OmpR family regulator